MKYIWIVMLIMLFVGMWIRVFNDFFYNIKKYSFRESLEELDACDWAWIITNVIILFMYSLMKFITS